MADRMIVMHAGVAEQIGTPLEVYETPRTLFAAQFIGSPAMNVFDAEISDGVVKLGNATIGSVQGQDGPVKLGLRPEHLVATDDGPIEAHIQMSEPLGANTLLHGRLSESGHAITISLAGVHTIGDGGATQRFSAKAEHVHLFDPVTGQRRGD